MTFHTARRAFSTFPTAPALFTKAFYTTTLVRSSPVKVGRCLVTILPITFQR